MEEAHKAVLKRKRVHSDKIIPVPNKIRDCNKVSPVPLICEKGYHHYSTDLAYSNVVGESNLTCFFKLKN